MIVKRGDKWLLVSSTGKILGTHPSKDAAESQEAAIKLSQLRAKGERIPEKKG